jgi:hypothetical protein
MTRWTMGEKKLIRASARRRGLQRGWMGGLLARRRTLEKEMERGRLPRYRTAVLTHRCAFLQILSGTGRSLKILSSSFSCIEP